MIKIMSKPLLYNDESRLCWRHFVEMLTLSSRPLRHSLNIELSLSVSLFFLSPGGRQTSKMLVFCHVFYVDGCLTTRPDKNSVTLPSKRRPGQQTSNIYIVGSGRETFFWGSQCHAKISYALLIGMSAGLKHEVSHQDAFYMRNYPGFSRSCFKPNRRTRVLPNTTPNAAWFLFRKKKTKNLKIDQTIHKPVNHFTNQIKWQAWNTE